MLPRGGQGVIEKLFVQLLKNNINIYFTRTYTAAAKMIVNMPKYNTDRFTPNGIHLHFLPDKARIISLICLLAHKSLSSGEPEYSKKYLNQLKVQVYQFNV